MNASAKRVLFWTPRILCILFAIFLSVFALDVFSEGYGFWQTIGALLLHLVPTFIVVIALLIGLAMGMGWSSPIRCIGSVLCGLDVGTLSFSHLFIHLRSLGNGGCSFPV